MPVHPEIGYRYRGWGGEISLLTRYDKRVDYFMRVLVPADPLPGEKVRPVGQVFDVSVRAIGRTYHRVDWNEEPVAHEQPCDCYCCKPKEAL